MAPVDRALLRRLVPNVVAAAAAERLRLRCGPFEAFIAEATDEYFMSFAVPVETQDDWRPALGALDRLFRDHGRIARMEFFRDLHPALAPTLYALGWHRNMEAPVMVLEAARWIGAPPDPAVLVGPDDADGVDAALAVQQAAFEPALDAVALADWRAKLAAGIASGALRVAVIRVGDMPVATAILMIGAGAAELAGVGTHPDHRRQGHALRACRALLADHFAAGDDPAWLSAAPGATALYRRLGFREVGTQLNFGLKRV